MIVLDNSQLNHFNFFNCSNSLNLKVFSIWPLVSITAELNLQLIRDVCLASCDKYRLTVVKLEGDFSPTAAYKTLLIQVDVTVGTTMMSVLRMIAFTVSAFVEMNWLGCQELAINVHYLEFSISLIFRVRPFHAHIPYTLLQFIHILEGAVDFVTESVCSFCP